MRQRKTRRQIQDNDGDTDEKYQDRGALVPFNGRHIHPSVNRIQQMAEQARAGNVATGRTKKKEKRPVNVQRHEEPATREEELRAIREHEAEEGDQYVDLEDAQSLYLEEYATQPIPVWRPMISTPGKVTLLDSKLNSVLSSTIHTPRIIETKSSPVRSISRPPSFPPPPPPVQKHTVEAHHVRQQQQQQQQHYQQPYQQPYQQQQQQPEPPTIILTPQEVPSRWFSRLTRVVSCLLFTSTTENEYWFGACDLKKCGFWDKLKFVLTGDAFVADPNIVYYTMFMLLVKLFLAFGVFVAIKLLAFPWWTINTCHWSIPRDQCGTLTDYNGHTLYCSSTLSMLDPVIKSKSEQQVLHNQDIGRARRCKFTFYKYVKVSSFRTSSNNLDSRGYDLLSDSDSICYQKLLIWESMKALTDDQKRRDFECTHIGDASAYESAWSDFFRFA